MGKTMSDTETTNAANSLVYIVTTMSSYLSNVSSIKLEIVDSNSKAGGEAEEDENWNSVGRGGAKHSA